MVSPKPPNLTLPNKKKLNNVQNQNDHLILKKTRILKYIYIL